MKMISLTYSGIIKNIRSKQTITSLIKEDKEIGVNN